ncbi:unnamed protein product [Pleuronectes platessa]|uniref:Uncharacterized protein n=1 Tax=Pleuronectes platessa TaxID=8262 RepID=A0A9N7V3Q5_PLEPL|nr:unnamed protein product [Pleuronectes platessa]
MDEELAKHLKQLADQFHGLAPVKCRELAFEYAEKNNIPVTANWTEKQCAGAAVAEGVEWSSSNLKVGGSIPSLTHLRAEVSLGKMLNPEWPPTE